MTNQQHTANSRFSIIFHHSCYQTLHTCAKHFFINLSLVFKPSYVIGGLKSRTNAVCSNSSSNSGVLSIHRLATLLGELMRRVLAPLRRIVSRELELYRAHPNGKPWQFAIHDRMECGHTHTSLLWDVFDLLDGYTESAHVKAARHRCSECKTLTATKKPPQSVGQIKTAVA